MSTPQISPTLVLLIDDHAIVRAGLRVLLETCPTLKVVGEAGNTIDALALAARERPDVILLDLDLGGEDGLALLPELLAIHNKARVLILTGATDPAAYQQAMRLGAMGLVHKDKAPELLIKAIEKVCSGEVWFDRALINSVLAEMSRREDGKAVDPDALNIATLTERECEVVRLIGEGLKNKQIAGRLFISETTVHHHLTSVFAKLGVSDRLELAIYAFKHKLATPPSARHN